MNGRTMICVGTIARAGAFAADEPAHAALTLTAVGGGGGSEAFLPPGAMMLIGFAGLGYAGYRKAKSRALPLPTT